MLGVEGAEQILHYCPCCRITMKWVKKFVFFVLQSFTLNSFTFFFKKYTTNQNQKCKGWAFRDFIIDLFRKCLSKKKEKTRKLAQTMRL
jgi:hypothetical protein